MAGFDRRRRAGINRKLTSLGRATISATLFDLGIYPAAVRSPDGTVWGELYEMAEAERVLAVLDDIEGCRPGLPDQSLYVREQTDVRRSDGTTVSAWVYFYNAPLGQAPRIASGDYREHIKAG